MKKYLILAICLMAVNVFAADECFNLTYSSAVAVSATAQAPNTCTRCDGTTTSCSIDTAKAYSITAQLATTTGSGTSTDLNFGYADDSTSSYYECITALGNNKKKTCLITPGQSLQFTVDNNDGTNTITPTITVNVIYPK